MILAKEASFYLEKKGFAKAIFPDLCSNIGKKINRQGKF